MSGLDKQAVVEAVRRRIKDRHPGGATLEVVEQDVREEKYWWYVPVCPSVEPVKRYEYYETLADVEGELQDHEQLTVLLVPAAPA